MVKKFEFSSNLLELDINGANFQIDTTDPELMQKIEDFSVEALSFVDKAEERAKEMGNTKAWVEMIELLTKTIDVMLGEGSTKKIFKDRKVNFFDCIDIVNFINIEIGKFREGKLQKYSPNRAQRRAKK